MEETKEISALQYISVDLLHPHPDNPRKDVGDIAELSESIKQNGIFQNLTVIPKSDDGYTVIIGHRRLAAAKLAGLTSVPCIVTEMSEKEQMQTMLLENMQRSDLTVYEQAQGFQMMLDLGSTVEEVAEKSGFSVTTVKRRVKMMELDQDKLKEVSSRQLSLTDFDTLAQIENIKERNKVLGSIGTRDFNQEVSYALTKQKEEKNLPLVKAWLKEVGATEIKSSDTYGSKYECYAGQYSYNISKWNEEGNKPPKVGKVPIFYVLDSWGTLRLYKKAEKKKPVKISQKELDRNKAVNEAWGILDSTASAAHDLRKQFVENIHITSKNRSDVMYGALMAHLLEAVDYNSPDRSSICKLFGIETNVYDSNRSQKLLDGINSIHDKDIPMLIYAGFGDADKENCTRNYKGDFPNYHPSTKLSILYKWLKMLGYEMSTDEIQLVNGEHPAFVAGKLYDSGKDEK